MGISPEVGCLNCVGCKPEWMIYWVYVRFQRNICIEVDFRSSCAMTIPWAGVVGGGGGRGEEERRQSSLGLARHQKYNTDILTWDFLL
jgi:hypothetical protein